MRDDLRGRNLRDQIQEKQGEELDQLLQEIIDRYGQVLPDYELACLFVPKNDPAERNRILSRLTAPGFWEYN